MVSRSVNIKGYKIKVNNKSFWEEKYGENNTPWDIGQASPAFVNYLNENTTLFQKREKFAKPQNNSIATAYKRRTPGQSEIKFEDFKSKTAKQLHNFVRALQEPYPNAFVVCKGGAKLYILKTRAEEK